MYRILLADDEPLEREVLRLFVEQSGLPVSEILECANGLETIGVVAQRQPDLCILDIKMPGLSGHEAAKQILAIHKECKIIFSTAYNYFDYALKALQLGATDFLVKPVAREQLIATLRKAFDRLEEERALASAASQYSGLASMLEKKILGELIQGNMTEEGLWLLDSIGAGPEQGGFCLHVRILGDLGDRCGKLMDVLRQDMDDLGIPCMLSVHPTAVSGVLFCSGEQSRVREQVVRIMAGVFRDVGMEYLLGLGQPFDTPYDIERSYSSVRGDMGDLEWASEELPPQVKEGDETPAEVASIADYVQAHYTEKLDLASIASGVGFSKYYVSHLFKQHTGSTVIDYLIQVRIGKAKELLRDRSLSVKEICFLVGYTDPNYFTWSFKKYAGITPVHYRESLG